MKKHLRRPAGNIKAFSFLELSMVLVVIGVIIMLVLRGTTVVDDAKIRAVGSQYNRIIATAATFYERYGFLPGDGCLSSRPEGVQSCSGVRSGYLEKIAEQEAFWDILINKALMMEADEKQNALGTYWEIKHDIVPYYPLEADWLISSSQVSLSAVCALDRLIDDGEFSAGRVVALDTPGVLVSGEEEYSVNDDCWSKKGAALMLLRLNP